ncbi:hypothetical protein RvY_03440 [Ramazzottius varieornatus]|uniref:Uncharacterized protein n=1 Tax=Ramazzottius varieornatus TaxID=947166 RepID=A0A1D1UXG3_RAMVA|nr:hypothetical protein RvY_03440 [Ramazzottius varieornatus]
MVVLPRPDKTADGSLQGSRADGNGGNLLHKQGLYGPNSIYTAPRKFFQDPDRKKQPHKGAMSADDLNNALSKANLTFRHPEKEETHSRNHWWRHSPTGRHLSRDDVTK